MEPVKDALHLLYTEPSGESGKQDPLIREVMGHLMREVHRTLW